MALFRRVGDSTAFLASLSDALPSRPTSLLLSGCFDESFQVFTSASNDFMGWKFLVHGLPLNATTHVMSIEDCLLSCLTTRCRYHHFVHRNDTHQRLDRLDLSLSLQRPQSMSR